MPLDSALSRRTLVRRLVLGFGLALAAGCGLPTALPTSRRVARPGFLEFPINLKAADALGLAIPRQVLVQATETIR